MEKKEHAFKAGDWVSGFYENSVVLITEVTDLGYKTNSKDIPFISFNKEYSFNLVHLSNEFLSKVQDGDVLSWNPETDEVFNISQLERTAKPKSSSKPRQKKMLLRELINRLEYLSDNGRNDNMSIRAFIHNEPRGYVKDAIIDSFVTANDEFDFIRIDI